MLLSPTWTFLVRFFVIFAIFVLTSCTSQRAEFDEETKIQEIRGTKSLVTNTDITVFHWHAENALPVKEYLRQAVTLIREHLRLELNKGQKVNSESLIAPNALVNIKKEKILNLDVIEKNSELVIKIDSLYLNIFSPLEAIDGLPSAKDLGLFFKILGLLPNDAEFKTYRQLRDIVISNYLDRFKKQSLGFETERALLEGYLNLIKSNNLAMLPEANVK